MWLYFDGHSIKFDSLAIFLAPYIYSTYSFTLVGCWRRQRYSLLDTTRGKILEDAGRMSEDRGVSCCEKKDGGRFLETRLSSLLCNLYIIEIIILLFILFMKSSSSVKKNFTVFYLLVHCVQLGSVSVEWSHTSALAKL